MSTPKSVHLGSTGGIIIARGFGGEPARLSVLFKKGRYIEVAGADRSKSIGFPVDCAMIFDETLFSQLRKAFEASDERQLLALWARAAPYQPSARFRDDALRPA